MLESLLVPTILFLLGNTCKRTPLSYLFSIYSTSESTLSCVQSLRIHFHRVSYVQSIICTAKTLSENSKQIFPEMKLRGLVPNCYMYVSVRENYIFPRSVRLFCCSKISGPNVVINKSVTDTWMWKLERGRAVSFLEKHQSDHSCSVRKQFRITYVFLIESYHLLGGPISEVQRREF